VIVSRKVFQSVPQGAYIGVRFEVVVEISVPLAFHVAEVVPYGRQDWRQVVGSPWTPGAEYRR
jgi:hypothetical protein